uniref:zinc finger and BTB domain-containing protein 46-like n=1 Tax=Styela clava TaxID=7725 RepID=UPI001939DD72|nr:zinc finger and BTB domain-containing protein 46-like [Styela clava]
MKMAGMAQVLSHRDTTHAGDALLQLNNLRREGILCDLTIIVEGREYKAHKAVMAASSDYFLNAICGGKTTATVTPGEHGYITVDLEHVTLRGFVPLLEYAYTANLQVNASDVIDVLSAASYMQMFKVANACSEFMRSNILWAQSLPRLANFSGIPPGLLNGTKRGPDRSLSPIISNQRVPGSLPSDMSSLLTATGRANLGTPPLLIPMHPMSYGLERLAATMAGTQSLLSRSPGMPPRGLTPANSSSSPSRISTQSPQSAWPVVSSSNTTISSLPQRSMAHTVSPNENDQRYPSPSHMNGSSGRKSMAMKVEARSDDEDSRSSSTGIENRDGKAKSVSPTGSEPIEDSWQAIQKMYSMKMTKQESQKRHHPYKPRSDGHDNESNGGSRTQAFSDTPTKNEALVTGDGSPLRMDINSNNNNNNRNNDEVDLHPMIGDMFHKTNSAGISKSPVDVINRVRTSPNVHSATAAAINGAMRSALLQQQQLMAAQQNGSDAGKIVTLPAVPPTGQYMSVRRRTLQSTVPKPHQCQICGSRFTRFHNLKQHIKLHSGIKPYECDECGKRFTRNYTLRLHKMKHVGIRNFRCGTCDASFTSLGEFRAHLRLTMHSHVAGTPPLGSQSPSQGNSEPEDLSSPLSMLGAASGTLGQAGIKYPSYDAATMMDIQRGLLGERATLLTAALGGAMIARGEANGSVGSSLGSPRISELSDSPEDLSTKAQTDKNTEFENSEKLPGEEFVSDMTKKENEDCSHESELFTDEDRESTKNDQGNDCLPEEGDGNKSPSQEHAESSSSERDMDDRDHVRDSGNDDDANDVMDDEMHRSSSSANTAPSNSNTEQPMSFIVNASA